MSRQFKIAVAQYPLDFFDEKQEYVAKISDWVDQAVKQQAKLLVFPEYGSMELASLAGRTAAGDLKASLIAVSDLIEFQATVHRLLAQKHNVVIVSASAPCRHPNGNVTNVAHIFSPSGKEGAYHKIMPTPWEREAWNISPGPDDGLKVFDLGFAKIGLVICYDIEFPLIGRALSEAGAEIILAPSNTELEHGYWRVRTGCMARALENQVYTVHSPVVGPAEWCEAVDMNTGAAGVFAPSDQGFPAGGVVALGKMNEPQWVFAELDLDKMAKLRDSGRVQTYKHWSEQPGAAELPKPKMVSLI
ncbi:MAG: carbon-nitrogen hydrolase family protein [Pseudomonadota bacterium]